MTDLEKVIEDLIAKRKNSALKVEKKTTDFNKERFVGRNLDSVKESSNKIEQKSVNYKKEIINRLQEAKVFHERWMSFVQVLITLGDVDTAKKSIPVNYTMCDFGKWYYGEGRVLRTFSEYIQIEEVHKNVHKTYLQIYELYITPIKSSLFSSEKSQLAARDKKASILSQILDEYSKIMYDLLVSVENSVKKISNEELINLL